MLDLESDYENNVIHLKSLALGEDEDIVKINIDEITNINENNLTGDLKFIAKNYSYFSRQLVIKEIKKDKFKQILSHKIAILYVEVKKQLTKGGKEPSDTKIKNEVEANKIISNLKLKLLSLESDVKQLQSICKSIELKQRSIKDIIYLKVKHEELYFDNMRSNVKGKININKFEKTKETK